jgi:hypothetical protein
MLLLRSHFGLLNSAEPIYRVSSINSAKEVIDGMMNRHFSKQAASEDLK